MSLLQGSHHAQAGVFGSCGDLSSALTSLADQVGDLRVKLSGSTDQVRWTGPAADAFHAHASTRYAALAELVQELSASALVAQNLQCLVAGGGAAR